eukprot:790990-Prymnesium_polylepis.1
MHSFESCGLRFCPLARSYNREYLTCCAVRISSDSVRARSTPPPMDCHYSPPLARGGFAT